MTKVTITDLTQNIIITTKAKLASSFTDRILGLLISTNPRTMIFTTRFGIHTFFMKKAIDVIVLDRYFVVKKMKSGLFPNRLYFYHPRYKYVIEMPLGTIIQKRIRLNDKIKIT